MKIPLKIGEIMTLLSFVIPCYRSEKTIRMVVEEIVDTVGQREGYDYEIIAVNDCSPDHVYSVLEEMAHTNPRIKVVNLVKNMGKHAAVMAGLSVFRGDYVVMLDDDFQCPGNELWNLIDPLEQDAYDVVTAAYYEKKESWIKRKGSDLNRAMSGILLDMTNMPRIENFKAMKALIAKEILNYHNPYPYLDGLILRVTKRIGIAEMPERERGDDNTSGFTLAKSIALIVNGLTAFSVKPLRIASVCGFSFAAVGFLYGLIIVIRRIIEPVVTLGYSSIMAVLLLSTGLIMLMLGLIGEYLGRIYICINNSPQYVIRNTINIAENADNQKV